MISPVNRKRVLPYVMRSTKVMPEHGYKIPDVYTSEKNYTYQEILDMWKDDKFVAEEKPLVENFVAKTRLEGTSTFRYPENLSDYNKEEYANTRKLYEDYNYNVAVGNVARLGKKGTFPCASFYPDRSGEGQASGTGAVVNYPEAFGLEDAYYVLPYLNLVNGPRFGALGMTQSGDISKLSDTDVFHILQRKVEQPGDDSPELIDVNDFDFERATRCAVTPVKFKYPADKQAHYSYPEYYYPRIDLPAAHSIR